MIKVAKKITQLCLLATASTLIGCGGAETETDTSKFDPTQPVSDWQLVWSDEFDGSAIDSKNWTHEVNCTGGGNNERQCYTEDPSNSFVSDGTLKLVALPATDENAEQPYTSARIISKNKADFKYGRFEIKAKMPFGQGSFPAFWMLPTEDVYGGWPHSGEIDILETINLKTVDEEGVVENNVHGTLHYGKSWPDNDHSGSSYSLPDGISPADDFHVYAIEWQEGEIRWYVDGYLYATQMKSELRYNSKGEASLAHKGWFSEYFDATTGELTTYWDNSPFDQKFFMILNNAVGGEWAENSNNLGVDATAFADGQTFEIDYIRAYQCIQNTDTGKGCETVRAAYNQEASDDVPNGALILGKAPAPPIISSGYENLTIFSGTINPNWPAWDCCGGSTPALVDDATAGSVMEFTVGETATVNGFISREANITDPDGVAMPFDASGMLEVGYLNFDLFIVSAPNDAAAAWNVKAESVDAATAASLLLTDNTAGIVPVVGEWQSYSFSVQSLSDAGLDVSAIDVVMLFPDWGAGNGAVYRMNNLEIAGPETEIVIFADEVAAQWAIWDCCGGTTPTVELDDDTHGNVAEYIIGATPTVMGMLADDAVYFDASDILAEGVVQFEMKVTSMPNDSTAAWYFKIESGDAASAVDFELTASNEGAGPVLDQWQTYTFSLQSLSDAGLDVSAIDVLMFFPAWGAGEGAVYRVDNVKIYDPAGTVLFADDVKAEWTIWDCCGGSTPAVVIDDDSHGNVAEFTIGAEPTVMGILADDDVYYDASSLLADGVVQFEMKVTSMPNDSSAAWLFKIESGDATTAVDFELTASDEGIAPVIDQWQTYTFSLQSLSDAGLDVSALDVVMVFPAWGSGEGAVYRLDNVVIKAP